MNDNKVNENQIIQLRNIAMKCPRASGTSVFIARRLLKQIDRGVSYEELAGDCGTEQAMRSNVKSSTTPMLVFPNPSNAEVIINTNVSNEDRTLSVWDMQGRLVQQLTLSTNSTQLRINTAQWADGVYSVQLLDNIGNLNTQKLVVKH